MKEKNTQDAKNKKLEKGGAFEGRKKCALCRPWFFFFAFSLSLFFLLFFLGRHLF
jgi:hypothetical protein